MRVMEVMQVMKVKPALAPPHHLITFITSITRITP
jgi:hypothetical protein